MRIKGSDLRKIIKEEIARAHRMNEADEIYYGVPDIEPIKIENGFVDIEKYEDRIKSSIAQSFAAKFSSLVEPNSRISALRDNLDDESTVFFSGVIDSASKDFEGDPDLVADFQQVTIDGKPMPQEVVDAFNPKRYLSYKVDPAIRFKAEFKLMDLEHVYLMGAIGRQGALTQLESSIRNALSLQYV